MMSVWDNYVSLIMAKEMLAEAGEKDAQVNSQRFMNKNTQILKSLLIAPDSDSYEDDFDIGEDSPDLGIRRQLAKLLASRPVRSELKHYSGVVKGPIGSVCKSFDVDVDGVSNRISIDNKTKFQKYFFSENEGIHIYAETSTNGIFARYIINEDVFRTAQLFQGPEFDACFVEEYLRLTSKKQTAYSLLANNQALRRTALYALSYLATHSIVVQSYSVDEVYIAAEHFNQHVRQALGCCEIKPELLSVFAKDLFGYETTDLSMNQLAPGLQTDYAFSIIDKLLPFTLFAIMGGFSAWHEQGLSTSQIIIEKLVISKRRRVIDALCTITHPKLVNSVLTEIVEDCANYPQHNGAFNDMFFKLLVSCNHLTDETVGGMCDFLFRNTIYQEQAQYIHKVLGGPNGEFFRNYIMNGYQDGYTNGNASFHFCAAAITNAERHNSGINPLDCSISNISKNEVSADWLLNVMCLGMLAWDARIDRSKYSVSSLVLDQEVVCKLVSFLSTPDRLFFPIIACTIHDLILNDVVDPSVLGESERQSALQLLGDPSHKRRAEELLSVIALPACCTPTTLNANALQSTYLQRYEDCHKDPKSDENCEVLFAVLCNLGMFPTTEERQKELDRIMLRSLSNRVYTDNGSKWRIGNLLCSVGRGPCLWTAHSTQTDPATLGNKLTESKKAELLQLSKQLEEDGSTYRVTDTQEALDIIKFITPYTYELHTQRQAEPTSLGTHIIMEVPNPGSYIIIKWFGILCRYASGDRVLAYYRAHREVLDRPASVLAGCTYNGCRKLYEAYKSFKRGRTRASAGLLEAVKNGNLSVISAFMRSEYRTLVDNQAFVDSFITDLNIFGTEEELYSIYEGRFGTDKALERMQGKSFVSDASTQLLIDRIDRMIEELEDKQEKNEFETKQQPYEAKRTPPPLPEYMCNESLAPSPFFTFNEELEYSPTVYYDDRTVQVYTLTKKPEFNHWVMRIGFDDDRDLMKLAVSVNGENLKYATNRLQQDDEICLLALQQTGLALPYVRSTIRNEVEIIKPLLLASECVLQGIPTPYCNDPDIVLHAIRSDHTQLQYASDALRASREIAATVVCQPHKNKIVPAAVKWISEDLKDDTELMMQAVKANPQAYTYISPRLRRHPAILAMDHEDAPMDSDDIASKIQRLIDNL